MKVVAINGSPRKEGNTHFLIGQVFKELEAEGIETEEICIGNKPIRSCVACLRCQDPATAGQCSISTDGLNDIIDKVRQADGIILGSPVYYSGITGAMKCFCDRFFYVCSGLPDVLYHKVGAAVVAVRRNGGGNALDCLYKYLQYPQMMIATSNYWTVGYGALPGEVLQDEEGMQIMRLLGKNMAWMLKMREQGLSYQPEREAKVRMNFIR